MKAFHIPSSLHDVLGEKQDVFDLLMVGLGTILGGAVLLFAAWPDVQNLPWYRLVPIIVLVLDIIAGAVANFTRGTNGYYAPRPRNRLVFIAIHVHFPVIALLAGHSVLESLPIWIWTIVAAFLVNAQAGKAHQASLGGMLLVVGITGAVLLNTLSAWLLATGLVFMTKVAFSFAVNHHPEGDRA